MRIASRAERCPYDRLDAFDVLENLVIAESKYPEPLRFQPLGPIRIVCGLLGMLSPVQLDNEPCLETNEIGNIPSVRYLLAKPEPVDSFAPQPLPQTFFRLSAVLP